MQDDAGYKIHGEFHRPFKTPCISHLDPASELQLFAEKPYGCYYRFNYLCLLKNTAFIWLPVRFHCLHFFGIFIGGSFSTASEQPVPVTPPPVHRELLEFSDAFAEIAEKLNPSVVNITCTEMHEVENFQETLRDEDDDNQFGFGSGVIIDTSGFILTSNHVIESASKIEEIVG